MLKMPVWFGHTYLWAVAYINCLSVVCNILGGRSEWPGQHLPLSLTSISVSFAWWMFLWHWQQWHPLARDVGIHQVPHHLLASKANQLFLKPCRQWFGWWGSIPQAQTLLQAGNRIYSRGGLRCSKWKILTRFWATWKTHWKSQSFKIRLLSSLIQIGNTAVIFISISLVSSGVALHFH